MSKITPLFFLFGFLLATTSGHAQVYPCGTTEAVNKSLKNNPGLKQKHDELEQFTQQYIKSHKNDKQAVKIIPVVFHVIHDYGMENTSKAQIEDAVRIINEDFRKMNADTTQIVSAFKNIAADSEVEFRLARIDPDGNCTEGITRTQSDYTYSAGENVKSLVSWDTDKYLNVWVVHNIESGAGAYAYYPGTAPSKSQEGIVCRHTQLGSIGTSNGGNFSARTLTHEIGHYLNLPHTWGSTNSNNVPSNCNSDDGVSDTPNTIGSNINCNLSQNTCNSLDNVQNYMDYATCTNMFTDGQKSRMQAALNSSAGNRSSLWQSSNLIATGTNNGYAATCQPIADFHNSSTRICQGDSIQFTDFSYNGDPDSSWTWSWTFAGGTPSSSSQQNPTVHYNTPGTYDVTLAVTNNYGSDTLVKQSRVTVVSTSNPEVAPHMEGIEASSFPAHPTNSAKDWVLESNSSQTWHRSTAAASSGNASYRILNYFISSGTRNSFISPPVDFSGVTNANAYMYFDLAYTRVSEASEDVLKVYVSDNCGKVWRLRYVKAGKSLVTTANDPYTGYFVPSSNEWVHETVPLTTFVGDQNIMVKFEMTSKGGNYLYVDNINIAGQPNSINSFVDQPGINLSIVPNPTGTSGEIWVDLPQLTDQAVLTVRDQLGRTVGTRELGKLKPGAHKFGISNIAKDLRPGVHMVSFETPEQTVNRKVVFTGQ